VKAPVRPDASKPAPDEIRAVEALLAKMTLEEKLGQLCQAQGELNDTGPYVPAGDDEQVRAGAIGSFLGIYGAEETRRLQTIAVEQSRLGVPLIFAVDVIHGFRTIFPVPLAEAASFDPAAVQRSARIAAVEAAANGVHWTFAPMVDIARDARWGRIVEGSGEDPVLGSIMAAARVRGFQGEDLSADDTLMATAKHLVAYGAAEGGRDYNVADISERTLVETFLPPFRAAIEAGVQSVMAAFNEVGGVPMHANRDLIQRVLRGELGFEGLVVSDYTGVRELIAHGVAADPKAAGILALRAGVDVDMVSNIYGEALPSAVRSGELSRAAVDEAVRRVLRVKYRLGLFDDPYRYCDGDRQRRRTLTPEHRQAAREIAGSSMVLLKNAAGILPISNKVRSVAVLGPLANEQRSMLGSWLCAGRTEDVISPLAGITAAAPSGVCILSAPGVEIDGDDVSGIEQAARLAQEADLVLLCIGERGDMTGEARSRSSLGLPGHQEAFARRLQALGKPLVVILFTGRPLAIPWLAETVSTILLAWHPGIEAGSAIADVLFGAVNPAGRLPVTFPRDVGQAPIYYNHKNTGRPPLASKVYTSKYIDLPWTPLFPFGHGLSYTTFSYQPPRLSARRIRLGEALGVEVDVVNTGARAGDEVVQLYMRDEVASVTRPVLELRRFQRISLAPGERRVVSFTLEPEDFSFYGDKLKPVIETGAFTVFAGGSSAELLAAQFILDR
jgi:beta-glucosidase